MPDVLFPLRSSAPPEVLIVVVGGFLALVLGLILWERKREETRRRSLAEWARARGFRLVIDAGQAAPGFHWPFFASGRSQKVASVCEGDAAPGGPRTRVFRYVFVTGGGKHRKVHRFVCAMTAEEEALRRAPPWQARPRGLGDVIGGWFGGGGVRHPDDPAFADAIRLDSEDEPGVVRFFDRALRDAVRAEGCAAAGGGYGSTFVAFKLAGDPDYYDVALRAVVRLRAATVARLGR